MDKKVLTKDNVKSGMIAELRNGDLSLVLKNDDEIVCIDSDGYSKCYNYYLQNYNGNEDLDIVFLYEVDLERIAGILRKNDVVFTPAPGTMLDLRQLNDQKQERVEYTYDELKERLGHDFVIVASQE